MRVQRGKIIDLVPDFSLHYLPDRGRPSYLEVDQDGEDIDEEQNVSSFQSTQPIVEDFIQYTRGGVDVQELQGVV